VVTNIQKKGAVNANMKILNEEYGQKSKSIPRRQALSFDNCPLPVWYYYLVLS